MLFHYHLFGLNVRSDIPLLELEQSFDQADLVITKADKALPAGLEKTEASGVFEPWLYYHSFKDDWWAEYRDYMWMKVTEQSIEYYPLQNLIDADLKTYLMGTGLSLCLQLRGYFPLHGSMVSFRENGILFTGHRGAGKSTTAAYFVQQGGNLITDDVALIQLDDHNPKTIPAFPMLKLWNDALSNLGVDDSDLEVAMEGLDKKKLPVQDAFSDQPVPLDTIIELHPSDESDIRLEKCTGIEAFEVIAANIYRSKAVEALGKQKEHFEFCSELAQKVSVYKLYRPKERWSVNDIFGVVESLNR